MAYLIVLVVLAAAVYVISAPLRARRVSEPERGSNGSRSSRRPATPSTARSATPSSTSGPASCPMPITTRSIGRSRSEAVEILHHLDEVQDG